MKLIRLIIIIACLHEGIIAGQKAEQIRLRYPVQQQFILNKFILNKDKISINDTLQLDSLLSVVKKSWNAFVEDSLSNSSYSFSVEALNNLDAYSYLFALLSMTGKYDQNKEISYHLFKCYMLPSLIKDFQIISEDPSLDNLKLIWRGSLENSLAEGVEYYENSETFKRFYELFMNLKTLLVSYKNSDESNAYVAMLLNELHEYDYEIETKKYYLNDQPDISFTYLITGISTNNFNKNSAITFGKTLAGHFLAAGEKDKSIAILNSLFFNTSSDELPRDSLYRWYSLTDPLNGKNLFAEMSGKFSSDYFQEALETTVNPPDKWNLLTDVISQEKLKKAKYLLIDFWHSACGPCLTEIPDLNQLYASLKERDDVVFLSINTDYFNTKRDKAYIKSLTDKNLIKYPVVYDDQQSSFVKQFKITGYPTKVIINSQGRLITKNDKSGISIDTFYDFAKIKQSK